MQDGIDTRPLLGMQVRFGPQMFDLRHSNEHCLIIGLETLVDTDWGTVFKQLGERDSNTREAIKMIALGQTVAMLIPPYFEGKVSCDWNDIYQSLAIQVPIFAEHLLETRSIDAYFDANLGMLQGKYKNLRPAGREFLAGHHASPKARVHQKSIQSRHGYFGSNSKVDKTASLRGNIILGDNVLVDKGARISDSIILDSTYIGANTDCTDAIVTGNMMIKVRTGVCLELNDPVLFGSIA
jgi:hypothetical protein